MIDSDTLIRKSRQRGIGRFTIRDGKRIYLLKYDRILLNISCDTKIWDTFII